MGSEVDGEEVKEQKAAVVVVVVKVASAPPRGLRGERDG